MIGAIRSGGSSALWQWQQMQWSHRMARTMSATPVSAPESETAAPAGVNTKTSTPTAASALPGPSEFPYVPEGYGPEELATRTRLAYPDFGTPLSNALEGKLAGLENEEEQAKIPGIEDPKSPAEVMDEGKCETCEKRKYQDGSDDPGVSFKTPQHVDPQTAASAVRGHEQEHVVRERAKAEQNDRKVVSQSVTYHTGICPECGRFYVSGGTTRTVTAADKSESPAEKAAEQQDEDKEFDVAG